PSSSTLLPYTTLFRSISQIRKCRPATRWSSCTSWEAVDEHGNDGCAGGGGSGAARHRGTRVPLPAHPRHGQVSHERGDGPRDRRSEEHTSELQSRENL